MQWAQKTDEEKLLAFSTLTKYVCRFTLYFHTVMSQTLMRRELAHEKEQRLKDAMEAQEIRANDAEQYVMEAKYAALQARCVALTKVRDNLLQALMY